MKLLSTGKCDVQALKTQVQSNNTQQLHRITTSLWIAAPIWPNRTAAKPKTSSSRLSKLAPDLYPDKKPPACSPSCLPRLRPSNFLVFPAFENPAEIRDSLFRSKYA